MGRRRTNLKRGKKHEDGGGACKETWRRHDENRAPKNSKDAANSGWDSGNLYDWYGKVDVPAVTLWDDSGVREAWESAEQRKALPRNRTDFFLDFFNDTNIDWEHRTEYSIPESAEEAESSMEQVQATNIIKNTQSDSNVVPPRPSSPTILGLIELHKEKGYQGWECPPDVQIVPSGWVLPSEAGGEATGWDDNVQPPAQWDTSALANVEQMAGAGGWEPCLHTHEEQQPSWPPSAGTHGGWGNPVMPSAGQTSPIKDAGARVGGNVAAPAGYANGWDDAHEECTHLAHDTTQGGQQPVQKTQENWGPTYGWDDYPCYTDQASHAAQEDSKWWMAAEQRTNEVCHDSWVGLDRSWHQRAHPEVQEPLQVRREDHKHARHFPCEHRQRGHVARHWHAKQVWNATAPFTQAN